MSTTELAELIDSKFRELREGSIVTGTIQEIRPQVVLVDIGYKSEGAISISEFEDEEIEVGDQIEVLLERLENDEGIVVLSKEKAAHKQNWSKMVGAFPPGSQVDIIPPRDLNEYVGKVYEFKIVKVNDDRKNIVLSRREVIEAERADQRQRFLETVKEGDKVEGIVKNMSPMLAEGLPMACVRQGDGMQLYLGSEVLVPLLKQVIVPVLSNPAMRGIVADLVQHNTSLSQYATAIMALYDALPQLLDQTTKIELGLNFTKAQ